MLMPPPTPLYLLNMSDSMTDCRVVGIAVYNSGCCSPRCKALALAVPLTLCDGEVFNTCPIFLLTVETMTELTTKESLIGQGAKLAYTNSRILLSKESESAVASYQNHYRSGEWLSLPYGLT
jgi:hypothetical protein